MHEITQSTKPVSCRAPAVLTLLACGVSREDESVRRALDWIFEQDPSRTYEQACCLMAIDRAYMPKEELELLQQGKPVKVFKRALPPKRMAWARRIAPSASPYQREISAISLPATSPSAWD